MTAAVIALGLAVLVLTVLVAGLLRTHAEILRALHDLGVRVDGQGSAPVAAPPSIRTSAGVPAPGTGQGAVTDVVGTTLDGSATVVAVEAVEHQTLLAFLTSGCMTCQNHWKRFADGDLGLPDHMRLVIVAKDPEHDSPAKLIKLAPKDIPVVCSSASWDAYDVPVSPYFVLVDGPAGRILGEGAAAEWPQVRDLMLEASGDQAISNARDPMRQRPGAQGRRDQDADAALFDAGISPGDERLFHEPDDPS